MTDSKDVDIEQKMDDLNDKLAAESAVAEDAPKEDAVDDINYHTGHQARHVDYTGCEFIAQMIAKANEK